MTGVSYTTVPGKLSAMLGKIKFLDVPRRVTGQYLKNIGFTSSNDASLICVLRMIGFIDISGAPTARWHAFRGGKSESVLGDAVRQAYSELFSVYPDAYLRSNVELEQVFRLKSSAGKQAMSKIVSTFKNLAALADFANRPIDNIPLENPPGGSIVKDVYDTHPWLTTVPFPHIDVRIHISPETSAEKIEQIFASMAKHLYNRN